MNRLILVPVVLGLLSVPATVLAHHGQAAYESSAVTFAGTVTDFHFVSPHCLVEFDMKDDQGRIEKWQGEFSSPSRFVKAGWTAATLKPGDEITVTGYRARSGERTMWVTKIVLPNGQELNRRGAVR